MFNTFAISARFIIFMTSNLENMLKKRNDMYNCVFNASTLMEQFNPGHGLYQLGDAEILE